MLNEIQYEFNDAEIDRDWNIGITSTLKIYTTLSLDVAFILHNAGFILNENTIKILMINDGYFNFCVHVAELLWKL